MSEDNQYLAEGAECKELLITKNIEIRKCDSVNSVLEKINVNLGKDISAAEEKEKSYKADMIKSDKKVSAAVEEKNKAVTKTEEQTNKKKIWRRIAGCEAGTIVLGIAILIILL